MAGSFLKRVAKEKRLELERVKKKTPLEAILKSMLTLPPARNFRESLYRGPRIGVIAEIKKKAPGSPSWKPRIQLEKLVAAYEQGGALALSAVTEEKHFGGKPELIQEIKRRGNLPVLQKDFIVDPYQVYQARAARADAVLLIAELIPDKELKKFVELVGALGMTPVVEVHAAPDLKRAVRAGADVLLINNRDLNTLKVNMQTVTRLAKLVPKDHVAIAASGYKTPEDVARIVSDRIQAVLIGRALIDDKKPEAALCAIREQSERS